MAEGKRGGRGRVPDRGQPQVAARQDRRWANHGRRQAVLHGIAPKLFGVAQIVQRREPLPQESPAEQPECIARHPGTAGSGGEPSHADRVAGALILPHDEMDLGMAEKPVAAPGRGATDERSADGRDTGG